MAPSVVIVASCSARRARPRSEEHTSELQSRSDLVCRLLLEKKKKKTTDAQHTGASAKFKSKSHRQQRCRRCTSETRATPAMGVSVGARMSGEVCGQCTLHD